MMDGANCVLGIPAFHQKACNSVGHGNDACGATEPFSGVGGVRGGDVRYTGQSGRPSCVIGAARQMTVNEIGFLTTDQSNQSNQRQQIVEPGKGNLLAAKSCRLQLFAQPSLERAG